MSTPLPLLASFRDVGVLVRAADGLPSTEKLKLVEQATSMLPPVTSARSLGLMFGFSPAFVMYLSHNGAKNYRSFAVGKQGGTRRIHSPKVGLKHIQRRFGHHLARAGRHHGAVHGFVPDCSILSCAKQHLAQDWVLSMDIKNFFPSTRTGQVLGVLEGLGYPTRARSVLGRLMTLSDGLPQGAPSSPVLANLAFGEVDVQLTQIAVEEGLVYTRYADDLVFSGKGEVPDGLANRVECVVARAGWVMHPAKTRLQLRGSGLSVLGLSVAGEVVGLGRKKTRKLRYAEHMLTKTLDEKARRSFAGYRGFCLWILNGGTS